jgi:hypothetical protein
MPGQPQFLFLLEASVSVAVLNEDFGSHGSVSFLSFRHVGSLFEWMLRPLLCDGHEMTKRLHREILMLYHFSKNSRTCYTVALFGKIYDETLTRSQCNQAE